MGRLHDRGAKRGRRIGLAGALILAAVLGGAPAAMANTTRSTNWAGYAIHRAGVSFHRVSASWTQPGATCASGWPSYSAVWVGLGGYKPTAGALEQIGTELDCDTAGRVVSSAWYELVPAPSKPISLPVAPGDALRASVTVTGHRVVVELDNLTQHRSFHHALSASAIDVSSAEWIVEAPSECISQVACQALPLANFGSVSFASATAAPWTGPSGTVADTRWGRTKIKLTPDGQRIVLARNNTRDQAGAAAPTTLRDQGSAFDVTYATAAVTPTQAYGRREPRLSAAHLRH